jgi:hypothetical protein
MKFVVKSASAIAVIMLSACSPDGTSVVQPTDLQVAERQLATASTSNGKKWISPEKQRGLAKAVAAKVKGRHLGQASVCSVIAKEFALVAPELPTVRAEWAALSDVARMTRILSVAVPQCSLAVSSEIAHSEMAFAPVSYVSGSESEPDSAAIDAAFDSEFVEDEVIAAAFAANEPLVSYYENLTLQEPMSVFGNTLDVTLREAMFAECGASVRSGWWLIKATYKAAFIVSPLAGAASATTMAGILCGLGAAHAYALMQ